VVAAEGKLGIQLPELLKAAYTQVGNGGFGPDYGFIGLASGARDEDGNTLVSKYRAMRQLAKGNRHWRWPDRLLPVCNLGCGMWSCLDCVRPNVPVLIFDPNNLGDLEGDETDRDEAVLRWTNAFWSEARSFAGWLEAWLDGQPRKEPTWPNETWLRQRLWPNQPANVRLFLNCVRAKTTRVGE
jgi:hypothetical protein